MQMIETQGTDKLKTVRREKDTWILEVPSEVCEREGLAEGTLVSLTFKDGAIQSSYIRPTKEIDSFLDEIVEDEKGYFEEMKCIGD